MARPKSLDKEMIYLKLKKIPFQENGKFIVSNSKLESVQLNELEIKALKSGIPVKRVNKHELKKLDSEILASEALHVKSAKTVNYLKVLYS